MPSKSLAVLLTLLLCITGASAQVVDSILSETTVNNAWQNNSLYISTYNEQCRISTNLNKVWNVDLQTWVNNSLSNNKYDDAGRITEEITQTWDNNQSVWVNSYFTTFNYLDNTKSYTLTTYSWNNVNNIWQNNSRMTILFNNSGYSYYFLYETYIDNSWQPTYRSTATYNKGNQLTTAKGENWQNNMWVNSYKSDYLYSNKGLHTVSIGYFWNIGAKEWQKTSRQLSNYLPEGLLFKNAVSQYYDYVTNTWVNSGRTINKYDDKRVLKYTAIAFWDAINNNWLNAVRFRNDYYPDGSIHHFYLENWDATAKIWYSTFRSTYTHYGCSLKISIASTNTDADINTTANKQPGNDLINRSMDAAKHNGNNWSYNVQPNTAGNRLGGSSNYHVTVTASPVGNPVITNNIAPDAKSALPVGNKTFVLSPNPAKNYFVVSPPAQVFAANATLKLYDLSGKLMITQKLQATGAQKVALPAVAKGMYIVTITSNQGVQTAKLLVE